MLNDATPMLEDKALIEGLVQDATDFAKDYPDEFMILLRKIAGSTHSGRNLATNIVVSLGTGFLFYLLGRKDGVNSVTPSGNSYHNVENTSVLNRDAAQECTRQTDGQNSSTHVNETLPNNVFLQQTPYGLLDPISGDDLLKVLEAEKIATFSHDQKTISICLRKNPPIPCRTAQFNK